MLASGATYGNGHKVLVFLGISFDGRFNGAFIGIKEFLGAFAGQHIVGDGFVGSGKLAQAGHPEWIGQEPDIGHEIGIYSMPYLNPKLKMCTATVVGPDPNIVS